MTIRLVLVLALGLFLLSGCQSERDGLVQDDDIILVEVDGQPVSLPMLEFMMAQRGIGEDDHEAMRELLDELIRLRVVANAAEREGLAAEPRVRAQRMIRDLETLQLQYFTRIYEQYPVTDEDVRATFENQLERSGTRQFRLETIVYPSQGEALLQLAALEDGEADFDDLMEAARLANLAVEPTGWIDRSQLGAELAPLLESAEAGEVLPAPLQTPQGWRLLRVGDTRPLQAPALDSVREGIERQLVRQRLEALVEDLYQASAITPMLPLEEVADQ